MDWKVWSIAIKSGLQIYVNDINSRH